jgi:hypothetical protein
MFKIKRNFKTMAHPQVKLCYNCLVHKKAKKVLVLVIGIIFIVLGLFGLVLPFLQGFLFLAIGIILISLCFPKVRSWINKHTERYPHLFSIINEIEIWITKFIGEM